MHSAESLTPMKRSDAPRMDDAFGHEWSETPAMASSDQKALGAFYTPNAVVETVLHWALHCDSDRLLDPSCGDGRFIAKHRNSVGIEQDPQAAKGAMLNAPWALIHESDFFAWATNTEERFDCAAGNPPFIRYQNFKGESRERALQLCRRAGAEFSGLSSSWAPFLVATATLLRPGGRMAFVVPAEIGHAPYAAPLIEYLVRHFAVVHLVAIREKMFAQLSEDCWLLHADGFGEHTDIVRLSELPAFRAMTKPPSQFTSVPITEWRTDWNKRLRPFLLSSGIRSIYRQVVCAPGTRRLGETAKVGIGYVSGANDFFHLRPSRAKQLGIPPSHLRPAVRNSRSLPVVRLTDESVDRWYHDDKPILLLNLPKRGAVPDAVLRYLDSDEGHQVRQRYKCRVRDPWYAVPDVQTPDFFLTYMSGENVSLVANDAGCTCTNSVHAVTLRPGVDPGGITKAWGSPFVMLSCELEGHPLGGGMLKLEPREAANIALPGDQARSIIPEGAMEDAVALMRQWRHCRAAR